MNIKRNETEWICTRPRLASLLMDKGFNARPVSNPWDRDMNAWAFDISVDLIAIVRDYYAECGKPLPKMLERYAAEGSKVC